MRVLYCKTFGIGNAVMAVPAIKALQSLPSIEVVDVLVGDTLDDFGAKEILGMGVLTKGKVCINQSLEREYDLAILAIPYDGRWQNGIHFKAKRTVDGRTRPDPSTTGLVSWKKHEVQYQMDNVDALGYNGPIPDCSFHEWGPKKKRIYVGVGYKKDKAGFWKVKHFGNENFACLIKNVLQVENCGIVSTGDMLDLKLSMAPIKRLVNDPRYKIETPTFLESLRIVSESGVYVGNDTGMMHVAAAAGCRTVGIFRMGSDAITKSHPWCSNCLVVDYTPGAELQPPRLDELARMLWT